jgi:hypothetical protein
MPDPPSTFYLPSTAGLARSWPTRYWPPSDKLKPPSGALVARGPIHCRRRVLPWPNRPFHAILVPMLIWGRKKRKEMIHGTHVPSRLCHTPLWPYVVSQGLRRVPPPPKLVPLTGTCAHCCTLPLRE